MHDALCRAAKAQLDPIMVDLCMPPCAHRVRPQLGSHVSRSSSAKYGRVIRWRGRHRRRSCWGRRRHRRQAVGHAEADVLEDGAAGAGVRDQDAVLHGSVRVFVRCRILCWAGASMITIRCFHVQRSGPLQTRDLASGAFVPPCTDARSDTLSTRTKILTTDARGGPHEASGRTCVAPLQYWTELLAPGPHGIRTAAWQQGMVSASLQRRRLRTVEHGQR